ncbi:unnamed protein product [Prorocentrum cordatum]|uniref:Uncharacterized protein n=1 Tax=Prorocentrum cordatum TaxID=2364126 RepID=A0ABN9X9N0_9DINO|nr:unnamed protein product [Polarella glacialis]
MGPKKVIKAVEGGKPVKKPAAAPAGAKWHASALAAPEKAVKSVNEAEGAKSEEDGVLDDRQTSRAQRCVFEHSQADIRKDDWNKYQELGSKECKIPGKMKQRAQIVNACVSRSATYKDSVQVKARTLEAITSRTVSKGKEDAVVGMSKNCMIGTVFAGSKQLFQEAINDNEIYENPEDGLWYSRTKKISVKDVTSHAVRGTKTQEAADDSTFRSALADMMEVGCSVKENWLQALKGPRGKPSLKNQDNKPDATDFEILQESFDSVTQVTSAMKRVAVELCKTNSNAAGSDMARRGVQLCRDVVPSQDEIERLLMAGPDSTTKKEVAAALQAAAGPYRQLIEYYNELVAIHEHHQKGGSSSSAGAKFKAITG